MRLLGAKLLATRYARPEAYRGIYLPEAYLRDTSRSLWEVVETTAAADATLGVTLQPGWVLVTAPNSGIHFEDRDGEAVFLLAASSVRRIIPWTSEATAEILTPGQVLVRTRRKDEEKRGVLTVIRSDDPSGSCSGEVVAVAKDVESVAPGDVVVTSIHAGVETEIGGERLLVVDEAAVMAVV